MSFDDEMLALAFDEFGVVAVYRPPSGPTINCRVIRANQDRTIGFDNSAAFAEGNIIEVRKAEVSNPVKGGVFEIDGEDFQIVTDPRCDDPDRLVWRCTIREQ